MNLIIDEEKLTKLLKSFYTLTNLRIVIFDTSYNIKGSYPPNNCAFCTLIQGQEKGLNKCQASNKAGFDKCRYTDKLYIYTCHAGLKEAMISLKADGALVGYIMFGQIADTKDQEKRFTNLISSLDSIDVPIEEKKEAIAHLSYLDEDKLEASSTILLALAKYVMSEKILLLKKDEYMFSLDEYISKHIDEKIALNDIAKYMGIARTTFYELGRKYLKNGISDYINQKRVQKAIELLEQTDLSVKEITYKAGFSDYNYFYKVFIKTQKRAPLTFRKKC